MESVGPVSDAPSRETRFHVGWVIVILSLLVLVTFGRILGQEFVSWDDDRHITRNPYLNPPSWSRTLRFWRQPYEDLYIPVSYSLFALETMLSDTCVPRAAGAATSPLPFKVISLVLHTACGVLVWGLFQKWTQRPWAACLGAMCFLLHPLQVESVAWTSETRGLLAACLGLSAWLVQQRSSARRSAAGSEWGSEILSMALFTLGLLAKPNVICLAPAVVLAEMGLHARSWRSAVLAIRGWWLAAAITILLTSRLQATTSLPFQVTFWERVCIAADAAVWSVAHVVWPFPLGIDYGRTPAVALSESTWILGLAGTTISLVLIWRASPPVRLACLLFACGLLPTLGLQPFAFQSISTVADRYCYLALMGPALAIVLASPSTWHSWRNWTIAGVLAACLVLSHGQVETWGSNAALYQQALKVNPRSYVAWTNLGAILAETGDRTAAVRAFETALQIKPDHVVAIYNLGVLSEQQGDERAAGDRFAAAAALPQARAEVTLAWARWLERQGDRAAAAENYQRTLTLAPDNVAALTEYGGLLLAQGSVTEALQLYRRALAFDGDAWSTRVAFGHALLSTGKTAEAADQYRAALTIRADVPEAALNLGLIESRAGNWRAASEWLTRAVESAQDQHLEVIASGAKRELIAVLQARGIESLERNLIAAAVRDFQQATELDPASAPAQYHLARGLIAQGDQDSAREALQTALRLVPQDSEAATDISALLRQIGATP